MAKKVLLSLTEPSLKVSWRDLKWAVTSVPASALRAFVEWGVAAATVVMVARMLGVKI